MKKLYIILPICLLFIVGCDLFISQNDSKYSEITINLPGSRSLSDSVESYELIITGSDFEDIKVSGEGLSVSAKVLLGKDRTFYLKLYTKAQTVLLCSGETTVDLTSVEGENINISLFQSETLRTISYFEDDGATGHVPTTEYFNENIDSTVIGTAKGNTGNLILDGYTFTGWKIIENPGDNSINELYISGSDIILTDADIELHAIWQAYDEGVAYSIGDTGPAGGTIFFIDTATDVVGSIYYEVAAQDLGSYRWDSISTAIDTANAGSFIDWYLPSSSYNTKLLLSDLEFSDGYYWSSTEISEYMNLTNLSSGATSTASKSSGASYLVRLIRTF